MCYDVAGNLTLFDYPASPDITLQYDALGSLTTWCLTNMVDAVRTTRYTYNNVGQLLAQTSKKCLQDCKKTCPGNHVDEALNSEKDWEDKYVYE